MYTIHRATGEVGWWGLFGQVIAVCCSVLQCVAVRCSVLQCVAVCERATGEVGRRGPFGQDVAVCCSVLQCVAVCCSVLQCSAVCCSVLQCVAVCERATGEARRRGPFGQDVACAFRALGCPCYRNSKSLDTPLEHILKNQNATSTTMQNDYRALFPESLRFSSLALPLLPKFGVIWYTTGTHSQTSAHYQHYYLTWR